MSSYLPLPLDQAANQAPLAMRQRMAQGVSINQNFQEGIRDAFPMLSIKGRMFTARYSGQSKVFPDPNNPTQIAQSVDFIMLNASRTLSKTYFIKGYTEGDLNPPDCWSLDSIRPDPSVANKVSLSCITCPMNAFGSAPSRPGEPARKGKACQDARRLALLQPHMLAAQEPMPMLLRVPQSSLKNLKAYAQMLQRHGIDTNAVVTRLSFDYSPDISYPKLLFNYVGMLDEAAYAKVVEMADGQTVGQMLNAPDFEDTITTPPQQNPQTGPGLQGLAPQPSVEPVDPTQLNLATAQYQPQPQPQPVQQVQPQPQPNLTVVPPDDDLVELPDGKWFSRSKKAFVEPPAPKVEMPTLDPNVIELPGPQWFNMVTKKYVTGPQVGAPEVTATPAATTRKRTTAKPKETPAPKQEAQPQQQQAQPEPQQQAAPVDSGQKQAAPAPGNGDASHSQVPVSAAPKPLEDILAALVPPANQ